MLDQTSARIIVFNAPAGYGKTTLAAEWLQDHDSVTWYRATPASADVAAFSLGLAESLSEVTSAGTRLRRRLEIAESPEAAIDGLAKLLAEDLREWPDDGWIVLDDYHLAAESSAVESFLNCLLTLVPLRMVVTTRRRPRWLSARQVLYGEVLEFTHETLAMTRVEAEQTLETHAFNDSHAVVDRAAGWPALLGLAALAGSTALPEERMSEVLFRYFAEEVLRSAPAEIQRFMLRASVPVDVRLPSARDVLGIADPSELVERLRLEGLLEPVDGAFRFHPLLQEFLRQKLETEEPETAADIYVAAIEHCMSTRSWEAAFALAERSQALEKKEQILLAAAPELFATGRLETLGNWIDDVESDSPEVRPQVKLVRAEWLLRRGRFAGALKAAQEVTAGSHDETWFTSKAFLISGQAAHFVADDVAALKFHRLARETATTKDEYANATWGAFVASGALESEDARGFLDEYEGAAAGDPDKRLRALAGREIVAGLEGSYASVIPLLVQMYELSRESRDPMARTNALSTVVWLNVLQGKYRAAASMSDEALAYTRTLGIGFAEAFFLALRASAEVGLRQVSAARRTLESLQKTDAWADDPYLQTAHATLVVKLAITEGKPEDALVGAYEPTRIHFSEYGEYFGDPSDRICEPR